MNSINSLRKQANLLALLLVPIILVIVYLTAGPDAFIPSTGIGNLFEAKKAPWTPPPEGYAKIPLVNRPDFTALRQFGDVPVKVIQDQSVDPFKSQ